MRILITGSRDWEDTTMIEKELVWAEFWVDPDDKSDQPTVLVSGACPTGADIMCEDFATDRGWTVERHPADWSLHGKKAGFVRNAEMVNLGADICVAFIKNRSKGAMMTADLAQKAGIPTERIYVE